MTVTTFERVKEVVLSLRLKGIAIKPEDLDPKWNPNHFDWDWKDAFEYFLDLEEEFKQDTQLFCLPDGIEDAGSLEEVAQIIDNELERLRSLKAN